MMELIGFLVQGALLGVVYGMIALPLGLTFQTVHVADAAVGSYAVLAGIIFATVGGVLGAFAGVLTGIAVALLVGVMYQLLVARRMGEPIIVVAATFAVALMIESAILTFHGKDAVITRLFTESWELNGLYISPQTLVNLVVGAALVSGLVLVLNHTSVGRQIRASADNVLGSLLSGVPVRRLQFLVFGIEGLLCGIAGVLIVLTTGADYSSGIRLTLTAFGAAIIFGLRGPVFGFLGGIVLGVVQSLVAGYTGGGIYQTIPFLFVLVVLVFSPRVATVGRP